VTGLIRTRFQGGVNERPGMKNIFLIALVLLSGCASVVDNMGRAPTRPLNCAYADSHCAPGRI